MNARNGLRISSSIFILINIHIHRHITFSHFVGNSMSDYDRIARAISFINSNMRSQPSLEEIAEHLQLSPFHFQRMFSRWTGVTPKKYLQTLTVEHAKNLLHQSQSLLEVTDALGLSSSSRLHDHFVHLEAVTPGEFKNKGRGIFIEYGLHNSPFGKLFIANTSRGICKLSFVDDGKALPELDALKNNWANAEIIRNDAKTVDLVQNLFNITEKTDRPLSLLVAGTNFQINVWKALLKIPPGTITSYNKIANFIGRPSASRAVGNAIGANPLAFIIPCHRVIQQSGKLGGYRWGETRKHAIYAWEAARNQEN